MLAHVVTMTFAYVSLPAGHGAATTIRTASAASCQLAPRASSPSLVAAIASPSMRKSSEAPSSRLPVFQAHQAYSICMEHVRLSVKTYDSTRSLPAGKRVPCLSLTNIEVESKYRRQGRAREALIELRRSASRHARALVVENVVSPHM